MTLKDFEPLSDAAMAAMSHAEVKTRLADVKAKWKSHIDGLDDLELLGMLLGLRSDEDLSTEAKQFIAHDVTQKLISKRKGK